MSLTLKSFELAIICDENELETYNVKQEGPTLTTAFMASEAGKQFRFVITNNLLDFDLAFLLYIDGERVDTACILAGHRGGISGFRNSATSTLPFKFQELELVDPDLEDAPVVSEMGTIEVRAYRCHVTAKRTVEYQRKNHGLHGGRVSERSKKAGWHHVGFADEVPTNEDKITQADCVYTDTINAPFASVKVFYRPRELLIAQGVIVGYNVGAGTSGGSKVNDKKRGREDGSSGPSKRCTGPTVKKEELSADSDARTRRIQVLQAELNALLAEQSSSPVKNELRSPSPIVVGRAAGKVIDLTD